MLRQGLSLNLRLTSSARLTGQQAPGMRLELGTAILVGKQWLRSHWLSQLTSREYTRVPMCSGIELGSSC